MGADTPAGGGDQKPAVKAENNNPNDSNRGGKRPGKKGFVKKQRFLGADPNLQGFVFEARHNRLSQVANFSPLLAMQLHISLLAIPIPMSLLAIQIHISLLAIQIHIPLLAIPIPMSLLAIPIHMPLLARPDPPDPAAPRLSRPRNRAGRPL